MKYPTWILVHHVSKEKKNHHDKIMLPQPSNSGLKPQIYHVFALVWSPQKWVSFEDFWSFPVWKKKKPLCCSSLFFCTKATDDFFFRVFLGFPPGSEIRQNIQANESDCECFMGLCDRFGGENHKSLIFWVWPLTGCQWSQDYCIISRDSYINLHLPLLLREGPTPNLSFKQKSLWTKTCLLVI